MGAVFGQLNLDGGEPVKKELLEEMSSALSHRGPDKVSFHFEQNLGLGMRSLKTGLSAGPGQIVHNEDESIWAACDGEFYNYPALKGELAARGHRFSTDMDGEILVHLYEDRGPECWRALNGIFAGAIWDAGEKRFLLGRDRIGFKPLYYSVSGGRLLFASGVKALLRGRISREIDCQALHDYLSFNYVPAPRTIFGEVKKLLPGHFLVAEHGGAETKEYWDLTFAPVYDKKGEWFSEKLFEILLSAVKRRLAGADSAAIFLSGGLDSSTVLALCRELNLGKIRTFSIGFSERSYSELEDARRTAAFFGAEHHETVLEPDPEDFLSRLIEFYDEPFADSSAVPVYYVSRFARDGGSRVVLGGDGGDELFAGYYTYNAMQYARIYRKIPGFLSREIIPRLVNLIPASDEKVSLDFKLKCFARAARREPEEAHYWWKVIFTEEMKRRLYADGEIPGDCEDSFNVFRRYFQKCRAQEQLSRMQYVDTKVGLPDDGLVKVDRVTMANSLQLRTPILDNDLVDFISTVPGGYKLKGRSKKYIVKKMMANRLPNHILRGKKKGFAAPIPKWLKGPLNEPMRQILGVENIKKQGFFNPRYVQQLIEDHLSKKWDYSRNLWSLIVFTLWFDKYGRGT